MKAQERVWLWFAAMILFFTGYLLTNRFHFFEPQVLLTTFVDHEIGYQAIWVWIYVLTYVFVVSPFIFFEKSELKTFLSKFSSVSALSFGVFILFPTTMTRANYSNHSMSSDPATAWMLDLLRTLDQPTNCLPSLHVSISLLVTLAWLRRTQSTNLKLLLWVTFFSICFSTMATKQHYFLDVITGIALGYVINAGLLQRSLAKNPRLSSITKYL